MSLRRIFGLLVLFLFFETAVAVISLVLLGSETNIFLICLAMTGLAVVLWLFYLSVMRIWTRPRLPQPVQQAPLRPVSKAPLGEDGSLQELRELMVEANNRLASFPEFGARSLQDLPLYLIVGAEGSGKTSAIMNSGLEPKLLAGEAARDWNSIPTKCCNFWLAGGAVFADFSGRLMMQSQQQWENALRTISTRAQLPWWKRFITDTLPVNLRGVVLVCEVNVFTSAENPQQGTQVARKLHDRLEAVGSFFRKDFPVYVLLSKADGIAHFPEFFGHLTEAEDRRIVGATVPCVKPLAGPSAEVYSERESKRLTEYFNRLYMSLADKRLMMLAREEAGASKSAGYEFPRELKRMRREVINFLVDVFRPNGLQPGGCLRGFYFFAQRKVARSGPIRIDATDISVVKTGSDATVFFGRQPVQIQLGREKAPAMSSGTTSRWAFLSDVFNSIILRDPAGGIASRVAPRNATRRNIALAAAMAVFLLLSVVWANSWRHNRALLGRVEAQVLSTSKNPPATLTPESLQELEGLRAKIAGLDSYELNGPPLSYRWGLFSGSAPAIALRELYFARFHRFFYTPIVGALVAQFSALNSSSVPISIDVYSELKAYRMITSGTCKPDKSLLDSTLPAVFASIVTLPSDASVLVDQQIRFYASEVTGNNPYGQSGEDANAMQAARGYLASLRGPDKLLRSLLLQVTQETKPESLSQYAPAYTQVLSGPDQVDGSYTRTGWNSVFKDINEHKLGSAGEACVVGSGGTAWITDKGSERQVEDLYAKQYIANWKSFLASHHVLAYSGVTDAAQKLKVLADNNRSPLLAVVYMTSHNTDFPAPPEESKTVTETVKKGVENLFPGAKKKMQQVRQAENQVLPQYLGAADVQRVFDPVHSTVKPSSNDQWLNDTTRPYLNSLAELSDALLALGPRPDFTDQQHFDRVYQAEDKAVAAVRQLEQTFSNTPEQVDLVLKGFLEEPILKAKAVLPSSPAIPLKAMANKAAANFCAVVSSIRSKYPFDSGATQDATVDDLVRVFAPGTGELARFVQSPNIASLLQRQGNIWTQNPATPQPKLSPEFLAGLNRLTTISDTLFPQGANQPHLEYRITLEETAKVPFELDVDGHKISYTGKPTKPLPFTWPPGSTDGATLTVKSPGLTLPVARNGIWGLFRILQAADGNPTPGVFTFSRLQLGSGDIPLQTGGGQPFRLEVKIDSPSAFIFAHTYLQGTGCVSRAAP